MVFESVFQIGLFSNPYLLLAMVASILLQLAAVYVPFMQTAIGTVALSIRDWGLIVLVASTIFIADELRKLYQRTFKQKV